MDSEDSLREGGEALQYGGPVGVVRDDAFHGTTVDNALRIREHGFAPRLGIAGVGSYFDLGSDASARAFALDRADGDAERAVVIRAELCLGETIDLSFRRNPEVKREFQQFQASLRHRDDLHAATFNEVKETFLRERYPTVTAVRYFNERNGLWYVAMRDPARIRVLSMTSLTGREI